MNCPESLLREVRAHPSDDAPRLACAAWLREHGDPWGDFIVMQCRLARLPRGSVEFDELTTRTTGLLEAHGQRWRPKMPFWSALRGGYGWGFERGFPQTIEASGDTLVRCAGELPEVAPLLTTWRRNWTEDWSMAEADDVGETKLGGLITALELPGVAARDLDFLAGFERLESLAVLVCPERTERRPCEDVPRDLPFALKHLVLDFDDEMRRMTRILDVLGGRGTLKSLRLYVRSEGFGRDDLGAAARGLEHLDVSLDWADLIGQTFEPAEVASFARMPTLRELSLGVPGLERAHLKSLVENVTSALEVLRVFSGSWEHEVQGFEFLAHEPKLRGLRLLDLRGNVVPEDTAAMLRQAFGDRVRIVPAPLALPVDPARPTPTHS